MLKAWNEVSITSLPKKGDKQDPTNYCNLAELIVWNKLLVVVLKSKLKSSANTLSLCASTQSGLQ